MIHTEKRGEATQEYCNYRVPTAERKSLDIKKTVLAFSRDCISIGCWIIQPQHQNYLAQNATNCLA